MLTIIHAFRSVSRAVRDKFNAVTTVDIMANTLYVFGQGFKIACKIAMMAADSGLVRTDEDVISIGGSNLDADATLVLKPVNSHHLFALKIQEILCKPRF